MRRVLNLNVRRFLLAVSGLIFVLLCGIASPVSGRNISVGYFAGVVSTSADDQSAGWINGIECKYDIIRHLAVRPSIGIGKFSDAKFAFGKREGSSLRMYSLELLYHYYPCEHNRYGGYIFAGQTVAILSREYDETTTETWMAWGLGLEYAVNRRWFLELNGRLSDLNSGYATAGVRLALNYRISLTGCDDE